jgi:hypothetical protein
LSSLAIEVLEITQGVRASCPRPVGGLGKILMLCGVRLATLTEARQQQVTESFGRYISAIYADRFDSYAGQKLQVDRRAACGGRVGPATTASQ